MPIYADVHILQTIPPANINRDDNGNPKDAQYGGVRRARVSSQAWKRATRLAFSDRMPTEDRATRTRRIGAELAARLVTRTGLDSERAGQLSAALLAPLGIKPGKKAEETAYLLFFGRPQLDAIINSITDRLPDLLTLGATELADAVKDVSVERALQDGHPMDVALFGRMVAEIPTLNVDAATQVAHALSTHAVELEFDYYTAVDDQQDEDEAGAGMIGTVAFNSATLYRYATVNLDQLVTNLGDPKAAIDAIELFLDAFARSIPSGHTTTFAHRTLPSLVAVAIRTDQPVNLVSAFEEPVTPTQYGSGIAAASAIRLAEEFDRATQAWGNPPEALACCHTFAPDSATGKRLTAAFGAQVRFPDLLSTVRTTLTAAMERDQ